MTTAIETALTELSANLRRMEQRHQAVGYKFDRLYDLIAAARGELAAIRSASPLTDQDFGLLNQAVDLLKGAAEDLQDNGNDSASEGAKSSAAAVQRLGALFMSGGAA